MKRWLVNTAGMLALLAGPPALRAQLPAGDGAAPAAAPAAAAPTAAAAPRNIWSFLCLTPEQKAACKAKFCASPIGQMLNNATKPAALFSGGMVPSLCPPPNQPNPNDLKKPEDSAEGSAARIKKMEAEAAARRAAVRYLGTVDCRRYPDAEAALINALRGDPNECVRLEAALALSRGCCCTKKVMEALTVTVSGRAGKNEPGETSPRVLSVAAVALEHCLAKYCDVVPAPSQAARPEAPRPPEQPSGPPPPPPEQVPAPLPALPPRELPPPLPRGELPPPIPVSSAPGKVGPIEVVGGRSPSMPEEARLEPDALREEARRVLARRRAQLQAEARPSPVGRAPETGPPPLAGLRPVAANVPASRVLADNQPPNVPGSAAPRTGERDVWHLLVHTFRGPSDR